MTFSILIPATADEAEADSLDAACFAARTMQEDARESGFERPTAYVYERGQLVMALNGEAA
jgi:hypothetical protein